MNYGIGFAYLLEIVLSLSRMQYTYQCYICLSCLLQTTF